MDSIKKGHIAITWLGQAGFYIQDYKGNTITIDPYLSNAGERLIGFKRLAKAPISPEELKTDTLLITHNHLDHLDVDSVPIIMKESDTKLIGPKSVLEDCKEMNIENNQMIEAIIGEEICINSNTIRAAYADHGELSPDAIGFLITIDGIKIYYTGDTSYAFENMTEAKEFKPDIIILPINGAYGNLNSEEAMLLAQYVGSKVAIPCHFWTFREHGGNPQEFFEIMESSLPDTTPLFLSPGKTYIY